MSVATSLVTGVEATPDVAAKAVRQAMRKTGAESASSVLLFLTSEFARDPQSAIRAAAKAANCTQVIGCSATGVFTEDDWVVDAPAAAAMVFSDNVNLRVAKVASEYPLLTLAAPNAIDTSWLQDKGPRFGGVSGDAIGQGPFSVWENGKGAVQGRCEIDILGVDSAIAATHGLQLVSPAKQISQVNGYDVVSLDSIVAAQTLQNALGVDRGAVIPYHQLMAVYASSAEIIQHGAYEQTSLICSNEDGSITLSKSLPKGTWLAWAKRDPAVAVSQLKQTANQLAKQLKKTPDFCLLFSCLGRGPYFYNGIDKDLQVLTKQFPEMPLIGFYGNGEFAHINGKNVLLEYSAVLGMFSEK